LDVPPSPTRRSSDLAPLGITDAPGSTSANRFPAYVDLVRRQLARDYPAESLQGAGLSVMTGMSPAAQAYAEGAVSNALKALDSRSEEHTSELQSREN